MTPHDIGKFTHETICPIMKRAQKKLEAASVKTQLKLPHGDAVRVGKDLYATDIGQILYMIPSERMIKVEVVPERDAVVVSTADNPIGHSFALEGIDVDALSRSVDEIVDGIIRVETAGK